MSDEQKQKQLITRVPPALHKAAKVKAAQEGISLQDAIQKLLEEWTQQKQAQPTNQ